MSLAPFNKLPVKDEYIEKIKNKLTDGEDRGLMQICNSTGLTRTQAGCALDQMITQGQIVRKIVNHKAVFQLTYPIDQKT